jgi:aminoglycoside 6'-N-acetyltransferase I
VALYAEDGFSTLRAKLGENLAVLVHSDDIRVMVVEQDGDIVGFASTTLGFGLEQGRVAELEDLYVRPAHRRGGIGCVLIDDSAAWARSVGCRALEVIVAPNGKNVTHLLGFYIRRGFTDEGRRLLARDLRPDPTKAPVTV